MANEQMGMPAAAPSPDEMAVFDQMRQQISPKEFSDEMLAGASQADPQAVAQFKAELDKLDVPPEVLDALNNLVDEILANPDQYDAIRQKYMSQGIPEDILPEQFDPHFFAALNMAIDQLIAAPAGPQAFAKGGIAELKPISKAIAGYGRNGDTMLAHITPEEARMLEMHGGSGTINPHTGLPEFFSFSGLLNAVKGIITPNPTPAPVTAKQAAGGAGGTYLQGPPVVPAQVSGTATQAEKDAYAQALNTYNAQNRSYQAQKMINDRLNAYHKRMVDDATAQTVPYAAAVQTGNQVAQQLNPSLYNADFQARLAAGVRRPQRAGIASLAVGGYPRRTGQISGPGTETSDSIPAMLSDGEFVMTAKAVKGMGGGSRRAGAKKMYALMHRLEKNAARG